MSAVDEHLIQDEESVSESITPFVNNRHGYDDDDDSLNHRRRKSKKVLDELALLDKGFRVLNRTQNRKKNQIEVYSTNTNPGSTIRCPITGSYFVNSRVGKSDENLFFKVRIADGSSQENPITLFFDSPEQYERHMKTTVSQKTKETWNEKTMIERTKRM
jgi:hypothetical protein